MRRVRGLHHVENLWERATESVNLFGFASGGVVALVDFGLPGIRLRGGDVQGDESVPVHDATVSFALIREGAAKVRPTLTPTEDTCRTTLTT